MIGTVTGLLSAATGRIVVNGDSTITISYLPSQPVQCIAWAYEYHVWAYKSILHIHTSRHISVDTRPSSPLFLHSCEIKAEVGGLNTRLIMSYIGDR